MSEKGKPHFSFPCFTGAPVTLENVPGRAGGRPGAWLLLDASLFVEGVGEQLGMRGWGGWGGTGGGERLLFSHVVWSAFLFSFVFQASE